MNSQPNVIFLVVDTLRADHLGCYGYHHNTSPHIDRLASQGVLAEHLYCAAIPTQPSFTTMLTGQHPITHGIVAHGGKNQLGKGAPYLSQEFLRAGYTTCAVDNLVRERQWFVRGWEYYIDPSLRRTLLLGVTVEQLHARALPWLHHHKDEPFLMFIHYWDPHWPLDPPEKYRDLFYDGANPTDPENRAMEEWWDHPLGAIAHDTWLRRPEGLITDPDYVRAMYDQEIRRLDDGIGALLDTLDELGLSDNTLVVLTADHGESMTEHDIFFAHHGLYDTVVHVPLIARWPGKIPAGRRVSPLISTHDLAPTLLEAAGLPIPNSMDGKSAWSLLNGASETGQHDSLVSVECTWQGKWSIRNERYKFILARFPDLYDGPMRELYDMQADPDESHNLVEAQPELASQLESELERWIQTRLDAQGKSQDPVLEQGVTLGAFG
ncbi:MAG: sulfatase [Anaerolineales bacterium]|nr:sulfatase [Anaerolineales bacterium]MCB9129186.1 sulfatase [Ardenticatenales bacterium]